MLQFVICHATVASISVSARTMTERENLLASIATTIKDYRAGEIAEPTAVHVDRWIRQFGEDIQVPMLRELDHVFKTTYVSRSKAQQLLAKIVNSFPRDFWRSAYILDVQQNGSSQAEMRGLLMPILHQYHGTDINYDGAVGGEYIYLDDAIFTGERVIADLSNWMRRNAPDHGTLHLMVMALHEGGRYWIERNEERFKSGKQFSMRFWTFEGFAFENRRAYRNRSDVLWPTFSIDLGGDFQPRQPGFGTSRLFTGEPGRQLLERELYNAGLKIQGLAANPSPRLKPLGFSPFYPGFGSLFVTYRNCPNNCPLALWYGDPQYGPNHPLGRWYPLLQRKPYS